ncbi:MAG: dodecin family protein [Chitinophagaceae bacterium]
MAIIKVIELLASSSSSWEDATQQAVTHASKTLRNIRSVYVKEQSAVVENNKVVQYRVDVKISFELDDTQHP